MTSPLEDRIPVKAGPFKTASLSGFGGGYEDTCQRMLWRGVAWLAERKPPVDIWKQGKEFEGVYGVFVAAGEDLMSLEKAIIKPGDDATGAMHHCVMSHLRYIHQNGQDKWYAELSAHREPEEVFEWEGEL